MMRSTLVTSISAVAGSSGRWRRSSVPVASKWNWVVSMTVSTTWARSISSSRSLTFPESMREMSSRSVSMVSKRSTELDRTWMLRRAKGSEISSRASWICSVARRIEASGVRSSWETSETKRRCTLDRDSRRSIWSSSEVAMWLKDLARVDISSSPWMLSRSASSPEARRSAARAVCRTGLSTHLVKAHTTTMRMARKPSPPMVMLREARETMRCSLARL